MRPISAKANRAICVRALRLGAAWRTMSGIVPIALLLTLAGLLLPAPLLADAGNRDRLPITEVAAPEQSLRVLQPDLRLAGQGTLRIAGFRIYDVRLFVTPRGLRPDALTLFPFALDLRYAMSFKGGDIARRTRAEMEKLGQGSEAQRQAWEGQLARLLPDVRADDHLSGLYRPGSGTTLLLNGFHLADIPGEAFARAFFSIWLDPRTTAPAVRTALLQDAGAR
jgi:hypothetical protein